MRTLIAFAMALACATAAWAVGGNPDTWVITGTRVYASPDERPIDDGAVLVRAGKIATVGKKDDVPIPAATAPSRCDGGFVTPGFQNSHVHFIGDQWNKAASRPASELTRSMVEMLTRFGYTTVVDIASDRANTHALRARVEGGEVVGPRILTVGLALFPSGGLPLPE